MDTWNLNAISNITRRYVVGISDSFPVSFSQPKYAAWWQDDWRVTDEADPEPGSALRLPQGRVQQRRPIPALDGRRPSAGRGQHPAAPRLSRIRGRSHRAARRRGSLLHRRHRQLLDALDAREYHGVPGGRQRRASGLRVEPVQRSGAELPAGAAARLRRQHDAVQCVARQQLRGQRTMPVPRLRGTGAARGAGSAHQQLAGIDSACSARLAADMSIDVDYVHNRSRDEKVLHDQVEPRLQRGDGRELSVRGEWPEPRVSAVPGVRARRLLRVHRQVRLPRPADGVDQAVQQPVAGVGQLHAVADRERRAVAADERNHRGAVPGGAGPGRGIRAGRNRPAAPRGVQRHLAGRLRLPGERHVLLRLR